MLNGLQALTKRIRNIPNVPLADSSAGALSQSVSSLKDIPVSQRPF